MANDIYLILPCISWLDRRTCATLLAAAPPVLIVASTPLRPTALWIAATPLVASMAALRPWWWWQPQVHLIISFLTSPLCLSWLFYVFYHPQTVYRCALLVVSFQFLSYYTFFLLDFSNHNHDNNKNNIYINHYNDYHQSTNNSKQCKDKRLHVWECAGMWMDAYMRAED